jgi:hypothetical protein
MTLVAAVIGLVVAATAGAPSYVQADVLRIRKEPDASALIEGVVRINTELSVEETKGDWSRVRHAPTDTTGWVLTKFLSGKRLTTGELELELGKAEGAARVGLLERLLALEPNQRERYSALLEAYRAAGMKDRVAFLERVSSGQGPIFIGACVTGTPVLVAKLVKGKWKKLTIAEVERPVPDGGTQERPELRIYSAPEAEPLFTLADEVRNLHWAPAGGEQSMAELGTLFPRPAPQPNLVTDDLWTVALAEKPTCRAGELWVSAPFETVTPTKAQLEAVPAKVTMFRERVQLSQRWDAAPQRWIRPLFGDGPVVTVRALRGGKHVTNYYAVEAVVVAADGKAQHHVLETLTMGE